jgi:aminopeptidase-like protein
MDHLTPASEYAVDSGNKMLALIRELYPICRSITGNGVRKTLDILKRYGPVDIHEVPSGTPVFDWIVPKEWNITDAYIKNCDGERLVDFHSSNLHVVSYSAHVKARMTLAQLRPHLFSDPEKPSWVPYRTSYYSENWGFCLAHRDAAALTEGDYDVLIDSSLLDGSLTYGEWYVPGESEQEVLISTHICHPSLANDNLSGISLSIYLARYIARTPRRYSYRFLFIPGTIGSITWLCLNEHVVTRIKHGLTLACVGDPGHCTYKKSRLADAEIDRAAIHVLRHSGHAYTIEEFSPYGYDERQFCSPGFNLPIGCFMRTPHGRYPEYHTSGDCPDLLSASSLQDSFEKCVATIAVLEGNRTYLNLNPKCEPRLGTRGLYSSIGGIQDRKESELAILWVLNLSDGSHSLLDIAERSGMPFATIQTAAASLARVNLVSRNVGT